MALLQICSAKGRRGFVLVMVGLTGEDKGVSIIWSKLCANPQVKQPGLITCCCASEWTLFVTDHTPGKHRDIYVCEHVQVEQRM